MGGDSYLFAHCARITRFLTETRSKRVRKRDMLTAFSAINPTCSTPAPSTTHHSIINTVNTSHNPLLPHLLINQTPRRAEGVTRIHTNDNGQPQPNYINSHKYTVHNFQLHNQPMNNGKQTTKLPSSKTLTWSRIPLNPTVHNPRRGTPNPNCFDPSSFGFD
ncbi:hypothetical protein Droror1_Dr00015133 [Drosera rotundifolia]